VEIPVFILAGGRGERLGGVGDRPKPLLEVAGRPFVAYLLEALARQGFRRIFFLTGHGGEVFERFAQETRAASVAGAELDLRCIREETPLGTGGALRGALPHVERAALVLNGDTYCDLDGRDLLRFQGEHEGALCLTAAPVEEAADYGTLTLDAAGRVQAFREKGAGGPGWVNAGAYALSRSFLETVPPGPSSLECNLLPAWLSREPVWAFRIAGPFHDIGTPERLARTRRDFPPGAPRRP